MSSDHEPPQSEVLPALSGQRSSSLTQQQLTAASLDAAGAARAKVADGAGVSRSSIKGWRAMPEYKAEVERLKMQGAEAISAEAGELHSLLIEGGLDAIDSLRNAAHNAIDADGQPEWDVRMRASETLLKHGVDVTKDTTNGGGGAGVPASGVVQVLIAPQGVTTSE